jgi:hypothetical protein
MGGLAASYEHVAMDMLTRHMNLLVANKMVQEGTVCLITYSYYYFTLNV